MCVMVFWVDIGRSRIESMLTYSTERIRLLKQFCTIFSSLLQCTSRSDLQLKQWNCCLSLLSLKSKCEPQNETGVGMTITARYWYVRITTTNIWTTINRYAAYLTILLSRLWSVPKCISSSGLNFCSLRRFGTTNVHTHVSTKIVPRSSNFRMNVCVHEYQQFIPTRLKPTAVNTNVFSWEQSYIYTPCLFARFRSFCFSWKEKINKQMLALRLVSWWERLHIRIYIAVLFEHNIMMVII